MKFELPKATFGRMILSVILGSILVAALLSAVGYRAFRSEFPDVAKLRSLYPQVQYLGKDKPVRILLRSSPSPSWVRLDQVSKAAMGAVVVSEDWAFFQHEGFDPNQLKLAIKEDLIEKRFARGASTITMQVVKNVFLSQEKTLYRKFKEFFLAVHLDRTVTKKKILETYLNIAEWGEGVFGIGQASQFYFGKTPSELSPKEGAFLAMLLPSPKRYSQSFRQKKLSPYAQKTVQSILSKMLQAGYISQELYDSEAAFKLPFESTAAQGSLEIVKEPSEISESEDSSSETPREIVPSDP